MPAIFRKFEAVGRRLLVLLRVVVPSLTFLAGEDYHDAILFFSHDSFLERVGRHEKDGRAVRSDGDHSIAVAPRARRLVGGRGARRGENLEVPLESDAAYTCPRCSETNYVAVDPGGGRRQRFVEDCPVCCNPIEFVVAFDREGDAVVEEAELAT